MPVRLCCLLTVVLALFASSGCGPRRGAVQGTVTYLGKPLTHGEVILIGADGLPLPAAPIDEKGNYQAKGVIYGDVLVAVTQMPKNYKSPSDIRKEWKDKGMNPPPGTVFVVDTRTVFPAKYNDHATSGLTINVGQPVTQFDISMTKDP